MATTTVVNELRDVQFYTAKDPYYYTVDNRPLQDLDANTRLVAAASDASSGSAGRASLAAAAVGYSQIGFGQVIPTDPLRQGRGMFTAQYERFGFELRIGHGYLVHPLDRGGVPAYVEPAMAVHDSVFVINPQVGRAGTVQVTFRNSTDGDRVASGNSSTGVAVISFKQGNTPGTYPSPDAGNIAIMHIDIPSGASKLEESHIKLINMKGIKETSNILGNTQITYTSLIANVASGSRIINLSGSDIDPSRIASVEVFVQGVNQFDWSYVSSSNQIFLKSELTEAAEVRIRQSKLELI